MSDEIVIERRFRGPETSGNGGYVAGRLASYFDGPAEVTLRLPPPLGVLLRVSRAESGQTELWDGDRLIATAVATDLDFAPPAVTYDDAVRASAPVPDHPYPGCFVCGPERTDGLGILPGPTANDGLIAAPWTPGDDLAGAGVVQPQFAWAALDCPGGLAWIEAAAGKPFLLGRLAVKLISPVVAGERYVAMGWRGDRDGRKLFSRTALVHESGRLSGIGAATWFLMDA
jgi:hypothetical protein